MEIKEALATLDASHAGHWTSEGVPRVDVVSGIVGRQLNRIDIENAWPEFDRELARELAEEAEDAGDDSNDQAPATAKAVDRTDYGRTWLFHPDCPSGQVFEGEACADALEDGWVDSPAKLKPEGSTQDE